MISAVAFIAAIVLLIRCKRQSLPVVEKNNVVEKGSTAPSSKITRVRSRNNYTSTPIYEEVNGTSLKYHSVEHDYDFINSVSVRPGDEPKNYEVPESSPSKTNSSRNSSLYEVPTSHGHNMGGHGPNEVTASAVESGYDAPVHSETVPHSKTNVEGGYDTPIDVQTLPNGKQPEGSGYDTPIDVQTLPSGKQPEGSGYDTPIDAQTLPTGRGVVEECVYDTPGSDVDQTHLDSTAVYEDITYSQ